MADKDVPGDPGQPDGGGTTAQSDKAAVLALIKKATKLITSVAIVAVPTLAAVESFNAKTLLETVLYVLAFGGLLLVVSVFMILYFYARKSRPLKIQASSLAAAILVVMVACAAVGYLAWRSHPAGAHPQSAPAGTITSPRNGTGDVCQNEKLNASGTARDIQNGHHLWLFLYVASANNGGGLYYPGDQEPLGANGRWAGGSIYIGGTGQPGQRLTLWLADLGPQAFNDLGVNEPGQSPGFATLRYSPDVTPLNSVTFTTMDCASASTA